MDAFEGTDLGARLTARIDCCRSISISAVRVSDSALVSQRGEVVYESSGGMANIAEGIPMTADSVFRTWPLSKSMTSVAFMKLVKNGMVGLNDPLADFLPAFRDQRVYSACWRPTAGSAAAPTSVCRR